MNSKRDHVPCDSKIPADGHLQVMRNISRPAKVLHLINDLGYGGAQKVVLNLVKDMDRKEFVPIVGFWGGFFGSDMVEQFLESDIRLVDFRAEKKFDLLSIRRLIRYLSTNSIAILHTHLFLMHIVGRVAGKCAGTPWIITTHHNFRNTNHLLLRLIERISSPLSDITTYVSGAAQKTYCRESVQFSADAACLGKKHFTIYNSVNIDEIRNVKNNCDKVQIRKELGLQEQEYTFVCVGRLHPSKGHRYLIEATGRLKRTHPSFKLLIVGDGILNDELLQLVSSKGLSGDIRFLGYRDDVNRILAVSNALVQPSIFEGFGLASCGSHGLWASGHIHQPAVHCRGGLS